MKLIYFIVCISLLFLVSCNSQKWEKETAIDDSRIEQYK